MRRTHRLTGMHGLETGSVLYWVVGILAVVVLLAAVAFWYVRENPLALYERTTRQALAKSGMELRSLDSAVGRLAYWQGGEGSPIVLLHGVGDQAGAFQGVVEALISDHRLVIPDLPGHGDSEPFEGPLSMNVVYQGLEELLTEVAADEPVVLVGSSMGAWLATTQAHRHPETVARAVLINGGALTGERTDLSLMPADREAARTLMAELRDPSSAPIPDFVLDDIVEHSAQGPIGRMMAAWQDFEGFLLDDRLHEVSVPVDLLWGESDKLMTLSYAERMVAQLPQSRLTTIEGCGHHPANECPAKLATGLSEVLQMDPPVAKEPSPEGIGLEVELNSTDAGAGEG